MKRYRIIVLWGLLIASSAAFAAVGGGCLQGTWHYYDSSGRLVGEQTVGCGELDGLWGTVTTRTTFTQGCAASM